MLTNTSKFYGPPQVQSHLGTSDHHVVVAKACVGTRWSQHKCSKSIVEYRAFRDAEMQSFGRDLESINWSSLYKLQTCQEQYDQFDKTLLVLIEKHFQFKTKKVFSNDKPWITKEFKDSISKRQAALLQGDMQKYRHLRNKVNRMSSRLRSDFYTSTVQNYIQSRPQQWWRRVKRLLGENCEDSSMKLLANSTANGDMNLLAMKINKTFQDVTADLPPLLEQTLSETVVQKSL